MVDFHRPWPEDWVTIWIRPLQVVVWFLVHRPHQIITTVNFTIIAIAHVQLCSQSQDMSFTRADLYYI